MKHSSVTGKVQQITANVLGRVEPGKWICQLGLHLGTVASCNYVSEGFDKVIFLTMPR